MLVQVGSEAREMRLQAWNKTADEREKQQDVDRSEPEAGKDVEQLQLVEQRAEGCCAAMYWETFCTLRFR